VSREYIFEREIVNPANAGAATFMQLVAGTSMPLVLMKCKVTQRTSVTSTALGIYVVRKTAAASTLTAAVSGDIRKLDPGDSASSVQLGTALTGYGASGVTEGTDGDIVEREGINILNGWYYEPQPELRITIPGGGIIALKASAALASATYLCQMVFAEGLSG
jgi:hypothetical protein